MARSQGQSLPLCVRQAWDSLDELLDPELHFVWSLEEEEGKPWPLPLYPELDHLSWGEQGVDQEVHSSPCGLLQRFCPRHGPREESTSKRDAGRPDPDLTPEGEESEMPPVVEAAAKTPLLHTGGGGVRDAPSGGGYPPDPGR